MTDRRRFGRAGAKGRRRQAFHFNLFAPHFGCPSTSLRVTAQCPAKRISISILHAEFSALLMSHQQQSLLVKNSNKGQNPGCAGLLGDSRARDAQGLVLFRACLFRPKKTVAQRSLEQPDRRPKRKNLCRCWCSHNSNPCWGGLKKEKSKAYLILKMGIKQDEAVTDHNRIFANLE